MKPKLHEIHLLRGFGALGVVLLHTLAGSGNPVGNFLGYVIPIFIFISGFALTYTYKDASIISFYKKRFGAILWPYLIFAILCYLYAMYQNIIPQHRLNIGDFLADVALGKTYYHLWFFVILFQLYLLFPFLIKIYKKIENKAGLFVVVTLIIQIIWNLLSDEFPRAKLGTVFPSLFFYFALGMYFSGKYEYFREKIQKTPVILPVFMFFVFTYMALNFVSVKFLLLPLSFVVSFLMFLKIADMIKDKDNYFVKFLGLTASFSLGIYLIHPFIIDFVNQFINARFAAYLIIMPLSLLACFLLSKLPVGHFIIGAKR